MKNTLFIVLACVGLVPGCFVVDRIFSVSKNTHKGNLTVVSQAQYDKDTVRKYVKLPKNVTMNDDSNKEINKNLLENQFSYEVRDSSWAEATEAIISQRLSRQSNVEIVEVLCKTTVCKTIGDFRVKDPAQTDAILAEVRNAANFNNDSGVSSEIADNTSYIVTSTNPLKIRFSNLSKW